MENVLWSADQNPFPTFIVGGSPVSAINLPGALQFMEDAIRQDRRELVTVCSAYTITLARTNPGLRSAIAASGLITPDGYHITKAGRRRAGPHVGRVRGTDTLLGFAALAAQRGYTSYFYGAAPGVADHVATELQRRYPGFRSVGAYAPPYRPLTREEQAVDIHRINEANPDVLWVGLGCPKQEIWAHEHRPLLNARVIVPVGAAFDFLAGTVKPAPRWVQRVGLEWLWRFFSEPRRLWRRVIVHGPWFVAIVLRERLTGSWRQARDPPGR